MRRTVLALTAILAFIISVVAGVQTVIAPYTSYGQYFPLASPISITSPSNSTYAPNLLTLKVTFKLLLDPSCANISYSVDGKNNATIPLTATREPVEATRTYANGTTITVNSTLWVPYTITGWVALPELPEGPHNITVFAKYNANNVIGLDRSTVYFTINDGNPPIISNLSLENKTYNQNNLPLNFTTDEPTSWIGYCLDGTANRTIAGNTTLTDLPNGEHNVTVFAQDNAGNMGASETIHFSIKTESFPITWIVATIVVLAIGGVTLLVYFVKVKKTTGEEKRARPEEVM